MKPANKESTQPHVAGKQIAGQEGVVYPLKWHLQTMQQPGLIQAVTDTRDPLSLLDMRAPRYTSYPTADRFVDAFGADDYASYLATRAHSAAVPLSLYVHIPFCQSLCYYCACNKTVTGDYRKAGRYLDHLIAEIDQVEGLLGGDRRLQQMHFGGGTPTYLNDTDLQRLLRAIRDRFDLAPSGEFAIEIDPRTVDTGKLALLSEAGLNRLSIGVQDFDIHVQKAINRVQSVSLVSEVLEAGRRLGFRSTNFDLIYGLPNQSVAGFDRTMDHVIAMRPDRIALYNYAHLPARFKAQRLIREEDMPDASTRQAIFQRCNERLDAAGYDYIGMDHFALPDDDLSLARRTGCLQRNFQGYSTQPEGDLLAVGTSAISRIGSCYAQNVKGVNDYCDRLSHGLLPTEKGIQLSRDDLLRRALIMAIMCQGEIDKAAFEISFLIDFDQHFAAELQALAPLIQHGYVTMDDQRLCVTDEGRRKALRLIASQFDSYLQRQASRQRYSRIH